MAPIAVPALTGLSFRAFEGHADDQETLSKLQCPACGGLCLCVAHVSGATQLAESPVCSTTLNLSTALGRIAQSTTCRLLVVRAAGGVDVSTPTAVAEVLARAPCSSTYERRRCAWYGPRLREILISRARVGQSTVRVIARENIPEELLQRANPEAWYRQTCASKRALELEAQLWLASALER